MCATAATVAEQDEHLSYIQWKKVELMSRVIFLGLRQNTNDDNYTLTRTNAQ